MLKIGITGHRPPKIGGYDPTNELRVWVHESISSVLDTLKPNYAFTGMALGTDQIFAQLCADKGVPFTAVIPFQEQPENWPTDAQFVYWNLMKKAKSRIIVCEPGYAAWKMQRRNERMVDEVGDDGIIIAVWDGSKGGTANCVRYARHNAIRVVRIDPKEKTIVYPSDLQ